MVRKTALVMSGGGARGALQVGALRAILEAGYQPQSVVGTSIGASNAVFLGKYGINETGLAALTEVFRDAAQTEILSHDYLRMMLRALVRRPVSEPSRRIRDFYIAHGITPELKFKDLTQAQVLVVATDINHYCRVIYGLRPEEGVLESLLASTAIPPWVTPIGRNGQLLMDGGLVSNLPLEPALVIRPKEIIALDVQEHREIPEDSDGFGPLFNKLMNTVQKRQFDLEFAVAAAVRVPVRYIHLYAERPVAVYAFERWEELIERGYSLARYAIGRWPVKRRFL